MSECSVCYWLIHFVRDKGLLKGVNSVPAARLLWQLYFCGSSSAVSVKH